MARTTRKASERARYRKFFDTPCRKRPTLTWGDKLKRGLASLGEVSDTFKGGHFDMWSSKETGTRNTARNKQLGTKSRRRYDKELARDYIANS